MKSIYLTLIITLSISLAKAQELNQNETTKRWELVKVFEVNNTKPSVIYKRILTNYVPQSDIIQSKIENKKVVLRYQIRLGTFKYAKITETFDIRDGRFRWKLSDIVYLKANTSLSKYKRLDDTSDKSIIKKMNKLLPDQMKDLNDKIVNVTDEDENW